MDYLRKAGIAVLGAILLIYLAGSLRLIFTIVTGHAGPQPVWAILGGLYIRLMLMIFLSMMIFALTRGRAGSKK